MALVCKPSSGSPFVEITKTHFPTGLGVLLAHEMRRQTLKCNINPGVWLNLRGFCRPGKRRDHRQVYIGRMTRGKMARGERKEANTMPRFIPGSSFVRSPLMSMQVPWLFRDELPPPPFRCPYLSFLGPFSSSCPLRVA